jgi:hypothetical protein
MSPERNWEARLELAVKKQGDSLPLVPRPAYREPSKSIVLFQLDTGYRCLLKCPTLAKVHLTPLNESRFTADSSFTLAASHS